LVAPLSSKVSTLKESSVSGRVIFSGIFVEVEFRLLIRIHLGFVVASEVLFS
jgi:hypothetical protein